MNYVRSNNLSLKYQGFPPSDSQDIGIRKFEFVAKSQFLYELFDLEESKVLMNDIFNFELVIQNLSLGVGISASSNS